MRRIAGEGKLVMLNKEELELLCDTLKKCHVRAQTISLLEPVSNVIDFGIRDLLSENIPDEPSVQSYVGTLNSRTLYKYTDEYKLCYLYLMLSEGMDASALFIGPYLSAALSDQELLEMAERIGVPPKAQRYFEEFYLGIPVIIEGNPIFYMLDSFCERLWDSPSFAVVDVNAPESVAAVPPGEVALHQEEFNDTLLHIKTMEQRYRFENELIDAVANGQLHKERMLGNVFSDSVFEKRSADPVRNAKNYCIIMNTLLRKAAERGGVHPVYLDKTSSQYAAEIEQCSGVQQIHSLMKDMFRSYCRLVRKHSTESYSLVVQKTMLLIDGDLSADLSLHSLAALQNISGAYLSSLFKKETGKTVSEYIRERRIRHAANLLASTRLQIQTIAQHCGVVDVQYFSKMFKKHTGKTPKEYREALRPR